MTVGSGSTVGSELVDEATEEEEEVLEVDDLDEDVIEVTDVVVLDSDSSVLPQAAREMANVVTRKRVERRRFMPKPFVESGASFKTLTAGPGNRAKAVVSRGWVGLPTVLLSFGVDGVAKRSVGDVAFRASVDSLEFA